MTGGFGEVAALYDEVRPPYPPRLVDYVRDRLARPPASVVDMAAGTGRLTGHLVGQGWPVSCVEPDAGMAAVLRERFPGVAVTASTFEEWTPPPGGVDLLAVGMAWHWFDPSRRAALARAALAHGGALAVFVVRSDIADPGLLAAVTAELDRSALLGHHPEHWIRDDLAGSGLFAAVEEHAAAQDADYPVDRVVALLSTTGPYLRLPEADRGPALTRVRAVLALGGDVVRFRLNGSVVLART